MAGVVFFTPFCYRRASFEARWPSGKAWVCKTLIAGSIPARASIKIPYTGIFVLLDDTQGKLC